MARLLEYLGDPPRFENVPPEFWDEAGRELLQALSPFGERVYLDSARRMLETVSIGVDWGLVNQAAFDWAETYTYDLVRGINDTSRQALQRAVSSYYRDQLTQGDLRNRLSSIFGPVRAEMIARTEVTRAAVEGERATVREIEKEGIRMVEVWQTRNDEIVCPICGPRHGKREGDGWTKNDGPPAHPRCRCWTIHEFATDMPSQPVYGTMPGLGST